MLIIPQELLQRAMARRTQYLAGIKNGNTAAINASKKELLSAGRRLDVMLANKALTTSMAVKIHIAKNNIIDAIVALNT